MAKLDKKIAFNNAKREGESWEDFSKREEAMMEELSKKSAQVDPDGDLTGALIRFQVADGYAVYVVSKHEPLTLQHVPYMDAYQANEATVRGVNKNTVRSQLMRDRAMRAMRDTNADFYASLKVGQTVHYHNAFGSYVRCEVVRGESVHSPGVQQNVLKPVALVGDWRPYDLPRRMPDGSVNYGYQVEQIREGKTMTPHESTIWESPRCARREGDKDPTKMEPISLEVPGMSADEERKAALWRKVDRLRAVVNDHRAQDPQSILDAVRQMVA
jgi:hypothetical protein